jgi:hypothetical protein
MAPKMTPAERSLRGQAAALKSWAEDTPDPAARTAAARAARMARFEQRVDPNGVLPPQERARRADQAFRAHMADMSRKAAAARRKRAAA